MGLIDLKTDLKSLKYGNDRLGGGDSGQPFIQTNINTVNSGFNRLRLTNFDDGLIRGGAIGALNASVVDTLRIGKFLKSLPKGLLFITKQVGLQLSNPKLEIKQSGGGLLNRIVNAIGPTRIYNLGINTLAQVPVNAFGKHFNRHGLLPIQDDNTKYFAVATDNNKGDQGVTNPSNRLVRLKDSLLNKPITDKTPINNYFGGPNSIYGIGRTIIRRYDYTVDEDKFNLLKDQTNIKARSTKIAWGKLYIGLEKKNNPSSLALLFRPQVPSNAYSPSVENQNVIRELRTSPALKKYIDVKNTIDKQIINGNNISDDNKNIQRTKRSINPKPSIYNVLGVSKQYVISDEQNNTTISGSAGDVRNRSAVDLQRGSKGKLNSPQIKYDIIKQSNESTKTQYQSNFKKFDRKISIPATSSIERNAPDFKYFALDDSTIYNNDSGSISRYTNTNDFKRVDSDILQIVFRIQNPFNNSEDHINFSAYMNGFKDTFGATWNEINYAGRAESFYVYDKFKRDVSFNLQIPCFNKSQLFEKHRALGQLAAVTAGSYNNGFLGGVLIKLNVGNYIIGEFAILDNLSYSIPDQATWDTKEKLAMTLDASFNFKIIHKKLPQYQPNAGFFENLKDPYRNFIIENDGRTDLTQTIISRNFAKN